MSVRYAPTPNKHWYVFRASYGREDKASDYLVEDGTYTYIAKKMAEKYVGGKRKRCLQTLIPNLLFAYTTEEKAGEYVNNTNTDFPQNNVAMWRQYGEGHKWHWIVKDLDFVSMREASWNMFHYMLGTDNPENKEYESANTPRVIASRYLYEKMMSFPEFCNRFLATYATFLGDFLRPDVCLPILSKMEEEILDEIAPTFAAYDNMSSLTRHKKSIKNLGDYIASRPTYVYQQMAGYFSLGDVILVSIQNDEDENRTISVCDTPLRTGRFSGAWFTAFPLSLRAEGNDAAWTMTVIHEDESSDTYTYDTAEIMLNLTECKPGDSVTFMVTDATTVGVSSVNRNNVVEAIYDLTGRRLPAKQQGVNIILYSDGTRKKVIIK